MGDSNAKITRAYEHLSALAVLITTFSAEAYTVEAQPDFWTEPSPPANGDVVIWAEASKEPPSRIWGPIIGDIVHGFRSALDQLIWGLSVSYQATRGIGPPPDPIPRGDPWRDVWFPVCTSDNAWNDRAVPNQLRFIEPSLIAQLKPLQPFMTGRDAPDREPLAVLQELWNIDKHRHLHLVNATVELHDVLTVNPFEGANDPDGLMASLEFEVVSKRGPGPLIDRTEIGRARLVRKPGGILGMTLPQMHMNPRVAIDVAFDQGYPAYGGRVLQTLSQIAEMVEAILAATI